MTDDTPYHFVLTQAEWEQLMKALDEPAKELPVLRELMQKYKHKWVDEN